MKEVSREINELCRGTDCRLSAHASHPRLPIHSAGSVACGTLKKLIFSHFFPGSICAKRQVKAVQSSNLPGLEMKVTFDELEPGWTYSRPHLASVWRYAGYQAISRGVVTPRGDNKIILFVTEEKQTAAEPYKDRLTDGILFWEGPTDHFAEERIVNAEQSGDEIHLFHRLKHHSDFTYLGKIELLEYRLYSARPSAFTFKAQT
jgi:hypothetical protein